MRKNLKIAVVASVLLLVVGAFAIVYACSPVGSANIASESTDVQAANKLQFQKMHPFLKLEAFRRFVRNASATEISGTVVAEVKGMVVLSTETGQVRILVPKVWTLDKQIVNRLELFNGTFYGQDITMKVLKSEWQGSNFSINVMIGYEATSTSAHAYAVLPFNIVPNS
jgi:hypothetical protein